MRRRLSTVLTATLVVGGLLLTAQPATGDGGCGIEAPFPQPESLIVGLSAVTGEFIIETHPDCTANSWSLRVYGTPRGGVAPVPGFYEDTTLQLASSTDPSFSFDPRSLDNVYAGYRWDVRGEVVDDWGSTVEIFSNRFVIQRATAISSFNAGPEPVTKGQPITIVGLLRSADWDQNKYVPLRYASVYVQFRPAGSQLWKTVKTVKSSSTGWVKTSVTATVDGSWRLFYRGDGRFGTKASYVDYVDVR